MFSSANVDSLSGSSHGKTNKYQLEVVFTYLGFAAIGACVYHYIAEDEFSSVLTLSAVFQLLAFCLLCMQVLFTQSAHGISAKTLTLDAVAIACRLSSTTWLQGYLPDDPTGEFLYQGIDILSLAVVLWLLYQVVQCQRKSVYESEDALPAAPLVLVSLVLGLLFHGDLDQRPIFDTLWMCGLFMSAFSVLPQLYMMARGTSSVAALTSHFVAVMAFSRIVSGIYMWYASEDVTCQPWIGEFNHATYAIYAAHAMHLVFLGDFAYYYVKHVTTSGLQAPLELPGEWIV